jgi:hypothetical protein
MKSYLHRLLLLLLQKRGEVPSLKEISMKKKVDRVFRKP